MNLAKLLDVVAFNLEMYTIIQFHVQKHINYPSLQMLKDKISIIWFGVKIKEKCLKNGIFHQFHGFGGVLGSLTLNVWATFKLTCQNGSFDTMSNRTDMYMYILGYNYWAPKNSNQSYGHH